MLDVAGQDATEAFEDVGHSDEARETLAQLNVGTLKRKVRSFCSLLSPRPSRLTHRFTLARRPCPQGSRREQQRHPQE